jgi:hypothetical protein
VRAARCRVTEQLHLENFLIELRDLRGIAHENGEVANLGLAHRGSFAALGGDIRRNTYDQKFGASQTRAFAEPAPLE